MTDQLSPADIEAIKIRAKSPEWHAGMVKLDIDRLLAAYEGALGSAQVWMDLNAGAIKARAEAWAMAGREFRRATMTHLHEVLARAAEVEAKATPPPWSASNVVPGAVAHRDRRLGPMNIFGLDVEGYAVTSHRPDADFIALSRTILAPLIAVARAAHRQAPMAMDHDHASDCGCCGCEMVKALAALAAVGSEA